MIDHAKQPRPGMSVGVAAEVTKRQICLPSLTWGDSIRKMDDEALVGLLLQYVESGYVYATGRVLPQASREMFHEQLLTRFRNREEGTP